MFQIEIDKCHICRSDETVQENENLQLVVVRTTTTLELKIIEIEELKAKLNASAAAQNTAEAQTILFGEIYEKLDAESNETFAKITKDFQILLKRRIWRMRKC